MPSSRRQILKRLQPGARKPLTGILASSVPDFFLLKIDTYKIEKGSVSIEFPELEVKTANGVQT